MYRTTVLAATFVFAATAFAASLDQPKEDYFTTSDGVKIHYLTLGSKGSWVVLIHGYTGNAEHNWFANGIAPALARNHRVVALDNRNHGKSDKPQLNGPGKASDTIELMDHLKIQKAHIGGYSMGGGITGQLLATHPERFITAHFGGSGIMETDPDWIAKLPPDKQGRDPQEDVVAKGLRIHHAMDNGMSQAEAEKLAETPPAPRPAPAAGAPRPAGPQIDLSKLNVPIIIINGELDRPRAKSMRAAREANQVEIVVLPGKSHLTAIAAGYMPKEYLTNLVGFIDSHDQN
ncbi:MAG TPA: alpha/beta hydrolase [Bryobacteraceae bacterium]|nr:alpha/beta hydrolase [Bryobacteraceae bacterium]